MKELKEEFLKQEYWSKSQAFLLPLSGLAKTQIYKLESYLFWEKYSIEDYHLIVKFTYDNYDEFVENCNKVIFPALDKSGYLIETHDVDNTCIMVLDISEWALDIELFLKGKYSKMSREAKELITTYHYTYANRKNNISIDIQAALEPNSKYEVLGGLTPIEYVAETYELPLEELRKLGEIGGIYSKEKETLI
jgi:hypothetical protein